MKKVNPWIFISVAVVVLVAGSIFWLSERTDALTGDAVSTKNLNTQQKKDYTICVRDCPSACLNKVGGACATEKVGVELKKQEVLSTVKPELTKLNLPKLLADGKVGDYSYNQKLLFPGESFPYIDFLTNGYDQTADFLYFKNGKTFAKYQLEFTSLWPIPYAYSKSVKSKLKLMGEEFQVIEASAVGSSGKGVKLILKSTKGDYFKLRDDDITDNSYSDNVEINFESIDGLTVIISGEVLENPSNEPVSPDALGSQIKSLSLIMQAADDYYVPVNGKLSTGITQEGEEKETLFTNNWDIYFVSYNKATEKGIIAVGNICGQ